MPKLTDEEMDAYDEGESAFEDGKPVTSNPYSRLSKPNLHTCWNDGWETAKSEADEDAEDKEDADEDREADDD